MQCKLLTLALSFMVLPVGNVKFLSHHAPQGEEYVLVETEYGPIYVPEGVFAIFLLSLVLGIIIGYIVQVFMEASGHHDRAVEIVEQIIQDIDTWGVTDIQSFKEIARRKTEAYASSVEQCHATPNFVWVSGQCQHQSYDPDHYPYGSDSPQGNGGYGG